MRTNPTDGMGTMADEPVPLRSLYDYRVMLGGKLEAGVKDIRVRTAFNMLPVALTDAERHEVTDARQEVMEDFLTRNAHWKPQDIQTRDVADPVHIEGMLVGTAEAAAMLGIERPRIGRYAAQGKLPPPVARLAMGPVWLRTQIEDLRGSVDAKRKKPRVSQR